MKVTFQKSNLLSLSTNLIRYAMDSEKSDDMQYITKNSFIVVNANALVDIMTTVTPIELQPGTFPTLGPALNENVQFSLTCVYISLFGFIFLLAYFQLWMIWYYRHKSLSHQTLFLFQCLIWAGLRTTLFSFYIKNCLQADDFGIELYSFLYSMPVCLQFSMLCLLLHFFGQVVFKARARSEPPRCKIPLRIALITSVIIFAMVNLICAYFTRSKISTSIPWSILYARVAFTEFMFLVYGILLSLCIYNMTKMAASQRVLEAKGTTVRQAVVATILITVLFLSRAIYNVVSVCDRMGGPPSFGYDWITVSDQADAVPQLSESLAYISFGIVLFVWEVLPIMIVMIFFRVRRLHTAMASTDFSNQSVGSRVFTFDNPRRYDSEEDLIIQATSNQHADPETSPLTQENHQQSANTENWPPPSSSLPYSMNAGACINSPQRVRTYGSVNNSGRYYTSGESH